MTRVTRFLALLMTLLLALPCAALAEAQTAEPDYNQITFTLNGFTIDEPSFFSGTLPVALTASIGMDGDTLDTLRAFAELDADFDGEDLLYLCAAVENSEIKLHLDGMEPDISIPMNQALEYVLSEAFLYGEPLSEAPAEFFEAFGDLLDEVNALISDGIFGQLTETPSHYHYSEEDWRSFFVEYPSKMRAMAAGEEEITFEGKTYTARKYTYRIDRLTAAEYDEYREGLIITNEEYRLSKIVAAGIEDAMNRMYEIGYAMKYPEEAAAADAPEDNSYRYSEEGTFYMIDEIMGTLETGTKTVHYPDGTEYVESIEQMSYMTDTQLVIEDVSTTEYGTSRESTAVTIGEDGSFTIVTSAQATEVYDYDSYSYTYVTDVAVTEVISDEQMVTDEVSTTTVTVSADGMTDSQTQTSTDHFEASYLSETAADLSFSTALSTVYGGETTESHYAMDCTVEIGTMSDDMLLRVSGKPLNPIEASEDDATAYAEALYQWLMNIVNSVIPAIETPAGIGGALLG